MEITGKIISSSLTWEIDNFSTLSNKEGGYTIKSPTFYRRGSGKSHSSWYLSLHPNGNNKDSEGYVSIFLFLNSCSMDEVEVNVQLSIINKDNDKSESHELKHIFCLKDSNNANKSAKKKKKKHVSKNATPDWGYPKYIKHEKLMDPGNSLLRDGSLTIHCRLWRFSDQNQNADVLVKSVTDSIRTSLWEQYLNQKLMDVTLIVRGKEFKLHKSILAANSPVFATMFDTNMKEAQQNIVNISDCDPDTFAEFIRFLYLGKVDNLEKFQFDLLVIAEKYAVGTLRDICEQSITPTLSVDNAIKILHLADLHSLAKLKSNALDFIKNHAIEITKSADWRLLVSEPELLGEVFCVVAKDPIDIL